jgi:hypothetical protein
LVLCHFELAENELKTTSVSEQRLSLGQKNVRFQKRAFSAVFKTKTTCIKNPGTGTHLKIDGRPKRQT